MNKYKILIVEDDEEIRNLLGKYLADNGYDIDLAENGMQGFNKIESEDYSLILLDIMLPFKSGDQVLKKVRETKDVPVIIISAKDMIQTKIDVMRMGADDYITKPFDLDEVLVRIEAVLRRSVRSTSVVLNDESKTQKLQYKNITLDMHGARVYVKDKELILTTKEYEILKLLMTYPDKLFSKSNLYESIWGDSFIYDDNTLMVHISNLRNKLKNADNEEYIETVWGMGYRLAK
ncbi:MAG: response regulator transcription factor [Eubacterium sp.]|nr:response regulator transcription factor [Eubacterium sp.]